MREEYKRHLLRSLLIVLLGCLRLPAIGQILFEDFQKGQLPVGWAVFDGDSQTPAPGVSQFTAAWIFAEDPDFPGDTVAMSTSWYAPVNLPADDWLISPQIALPSSSEVRWQAEADDPQFADGYEVRISIASSQLPVSNFDSVLFAIPSESGGIRVNRSINLTQAGYSNQNVYLAWRNISFDQYILHIDNIEVRTPPVWDVEMLSAKRFEYSQLSKKQVRNIPMQGTIQNQGLITATGVSMTIKVFDQAFNQISSTTSNSQILPPGAIGVFNVPDFTPSDTGLYTFEYTANMSAQDQDSSNNVSYWGLLVNDTSMARDNGEIGGRFGIGSGDHGIVGQSFELVKPDLLQSISFFFKPDSGQAYYCDIYNFNGTPQNIIARTDTFFSSTDTAFWLTLPVVNAPLLLPSDTFFIGIREPDSTLELGYSNFEYRENVTWLDWPGNPFYDWVNIEEFGFDFVFALRPNFVNCPEYILTDSVLLAACGSADGAATLIVSGGSGPYTYVWDNGQTNPTAIGLAAGIYNVTFTDTAGCFDSLSITVNNIGGPGVDSITTTNILCPGDSTGIATVFASGGAPSYSYLWSSGDTSMTFSGASAGNYFVTVTDLATCVAVAAVTLTEPQSLHPHAVSAQETCFLCNNGYVQSSPTGGTPPYTFIWNTGDTTAFVDSLSPGSYIVTISDANGCQSVQNVFINAAVGLTEHIQTKIQVFPNPNEGEFLIRIDHPDLEDIPLGLYDMQGKLIWEDIVAGNAEYQHSFQAGELASGTYLLQLIVGQKRHVKKIVIRGN